MKRFLVDPAELDLPALAGQPPLPAYADESLVRSRVPGASPEPLVAVDETLTVFPIYQDEAFGFTAVPDRVLLRRGVVDRLSAASRALPAEFTLVVLDGWRTAAFQAELLAYYTRRHSGSVAGYVSDPSDAQLVAPHVTGGAVDLTLGYSGVALGLGTDFDDFSGRAHLDAIDADPGYALSAQLRRLLAHVLVGAGLAPYPLEWWHWSFGDQRWAAQYGQEGALYGVPPE